MFYSFAPGKPGFYFVGILCLMLASISDASERPYGDSVSFDRPNNFSADATLDQAPSDGSRTERVRYAMSSLGFDLITLPDVVWDNGSEILAKDREMFFLLLAAGGGMALRQGGGDDKIADSFDGHNWISDDKAWDEVVYQLGGPGAHFTFAGLWYVLSAYSGDEFNKQRAWTMIEALSVTGATTLGLKLIVGDDTPNGKHLAWPSGHTSSSFTVAAVLDEFYGPEVGVPAYIAAGFVGYRMMDSGDHWASDVLFGAVLGHIVGHHVAGKHKEIEVAGFRVMPYSDIINDELVMGVSFGKSF